jgi:hypothetical protein
MAEGLPVLRRGGVVERGIDMSDHLKAFVDPKFFVALIVMGLFGWALGVDPDDATMKGALIAGFAGAWGYYLGSSNSSNAVREQVGKALDLAAQNSPSGVQAVEVVNDEASPVPVEEKK